MEIEEKVKMQKSPRRAVSTRGFKKEAPWMLYEAALCINENRENVNRLTVQQIRPTLVVVQLLTHWPY
jgi:hypothetical protein